MREFIVIFFVLCFLGLKITMLMRGINKSTNVWFDNNVVGYCSKSMMDIYMCAEHAEMRICF